MVQYTTEMEIYFFSEYFSFVTYLKCTLNIPHGQSKIVAFLLIYVHLHMQRGTYWEPLMPIKWSIFMHIYCGINGVSHALLEVLNTLIYSTGPLDTQMLLCIVRDLYISWRGCISAVYCCCNHIPCSCQRCVYHFLSSDRICQLHALNGNRPFSKN